MNITEQIESLNPQEKELASSMLRVAAVAIQLERERCAKIAEEYGKDESAVTCQLCAEAISAAIRRGE